LPEKFYNNVITEFPETLRQGRRDYCISALFFGGTACRGSSFSAAFGRKEKAAPDSRTANSEIKAFLEAEKLWKSLGITSYRAEVLYRRSNFPAEIFIITVEGDDVSGYSRQKPSESCRTIF
jgi:hypothetical protein